MPHSFCAWICVRAADIRTESADEWFSTRPSHTSPRLDSDHHSRRLSRGGKKPETCASAPLLNALSLYPPSSTDMTLPLANLSPKALISLVILSKKEAYKTVVRKTSTSRSIENRLSDSREPYVGAETSRHIHTRRRRIQRYDLAYGHQPSLFRLVSP